MNEFCADREPSVLMPWKNNLAWLSARAFGPSIARRREQVLGVCITSVRLVKDASQDLANFTSCTPTNVLSSVTMAIRSALGFSRTT